MQVTPLCDAHCHLGSERERKERQRQKIHSLICAGDCKQALALQALSAQSDYLLPAYGIHPWNSDKALNQAMEPFLGTGLAVGEIGMDSVWCQIPLSLQEQVFRWQLDEAKRWNKPVILHTKGQEKRIASIIAQYPLTYLVHWYSSMENLDAYLDLDCYFTVGPDLAVNQAVQQVASRVPIHRLLVETDGIDGLSWAVGETKPEQIRTFLQSSLEKIGTIKCMDQTEVRDIVFENVQHFLGISLFTGY